MPDQPVTPPKSSQDNSSDQPKETHLESVGEFVVEHQDSPPPAPPGQKIHPRRPLPLVPDRPLPKK
jgi:hypothetical protein